MNPWAFLGGLVLAVAAFFYGQHIGEQAIKLEMADQRANASENARHVEAGFRAKERANAQTMADIEKKARDEQKALSDQLAAAHRELRNRPERPTGDAMSKSPSGQLGCTGAQLYRQDLAFLLGEAARADGLRIALSRCQAAYDEAVRLTN
ncbi:hypothetical protein [Hydrogenophaga laconesensis]|uniref:2',3'-cyclic-nucleotide 2'-phosphodiesterase (5'-nucleotidase family) n=1 Tax=Hydrogenophaga laconesensis TaxID=1805971 RepID=A0ABU1VA24_9BURK|nr:hypothetical protein [Hydrogenophaga laconesensis]MDR7094163.1 2',3'-cyclic-nucleotide 2'-phosphodiesterase (5'-nucleotidase family) [Hydrogenophaga laconesensis]